MGRPRIKTIDDSQAEPEIKKKSKVKSSSKKVEKATEVKSDEASRLSEEDEIRRESTSSDVHEQDRAGPAVAGSELEKRDQTSERAKETKKPQKPGKAKPRSKKYKQSLLFFDKKSQEIDEPDRGKFYPINEAVDMTKKLSYSKFNATLDISINTAQMGIRGLVSLPYASGRQLRILAFGPSTPQKIEGVIFGSDETIEAISKGKIDFDLIITTPEWMPKLAKVAKILGPKGLMPNPKNNTITDPSAAGFKKAIESFQGGKTEYEHSPTAYKTEPKAPVMHIALGKLNQPTEELVANIKTLLQTVGKSRIKKVTLSPTMGPSVKLDLSSI